MELRRYEQRYVYEERIAPWSYLKTIDKLRGVQRKLRVLDKESHLQGVIKPFLADWGKMKRVVNRQCLNWEPLSETLHRR